MKVFFSSENNFIVLKFAGINKTVNKNAYLETKKLRLIMLKQHLFSSVNEQNTRKSWLPGGHLLTAAAGASWLDSACSSQRSCERRRPSPRSARCLEETEERRGERCVPSVDSRWRHMNKYEHRVHLDLQDSSDTSSVSLPISVLKLCLLSTLYAFVAQLSNQNQRNYVISVIRGFLSQRKSSSE